MKHFLSIENCPLVIIYSSLSKHLMKVAGINRALLKLGRNGRWWPFIILTTQKTTQQTAGAAYSFIQIEQEGKSFNDPAAMYS